MPNYEEFKRTPLDDLSDEEVDRLLNQAARLKRPASAGTFTTARPAKQNEVDLSHILGGLE